MSRITRAVLVCAADRGDPWRQVGGLPLIERLLRQLGRVGGIEEVIVLASPAFAPVTPSPWVRTAVRRIDVEESDAWTMLKNSIDRLPERFLLVAGDLIVDQRLFAWLVNQEDDVLIAASGAVPAEILGCVRRAGLMSKRLPSRRPLRLRSGQASTSSGRTELWEVPEATGTDGATDGRFKANRESPSPADQVFEVVSIDTFSTYSKEQRGDVPVHLLRVRGDDDAETAWRVLLDSVDKRTKDLPATLFDPPIENSLVRRLAPTRVTPNQVTVLTTILGFFVAWLFLTDWLLTGVILAIAVEVLDGVDGKLARLKYMTSKLGELEHVLDFFYENSWWLALGAGFAARGAAWAWPAALVLCASDLADNFAYLFFARRRQLSRRPSTSSGRTERTTNLDEASTFLSRFRLIAGRRNIYVWMLLPGVALGGASTAFAIVVSWAVVTAATHWYLAVWDA